MIRFSKSLNYNSILPFIGFILILLYIWRRYLKYRLPRTIPFHLTLWQFLILISICCSYCYMIYRILKPKTPPQIILDYIFYITNILKAFDNYLKEFYFISKMYNQKNTSRKISYNFAPTNTWHNNFEKEYKLKWNSSFYKDMMIKVFEKDVDIIIKILYILHTYNIIMTETKVPIIIKYTKVLLYIGYLICWGYILYTSLHTLLDINILLNVLERSIINNNVWYILKITIFILIMKRFNNQINIFKEKDE